MRSLVYLGRGALVLTSFVLVGHAGAHDGVQERLAALDARVREQPGAAAPLLQRAEIHRRRRDFRAAAGDIERARRLGADERDLALARARLHRDARVPDLAWADLRSLVDRPDAQPEELELAAEALRALGRTRESLPLLARAEASSAAPDPDRWLRRARWTEEIEEIGEIEDAGPAGALALLDEGLASLGPCVALELEALRLEERLGRIEDALVRVERLSAGAVRREAWLARRGDLLLTLGRGAEARAAYADALAELRDLPPRRRAQAATLALERELRTHLDALPDGDDERPTPPSSPAGR